MRKCRVRYTIMPDYGGAWGWVSRDGHPGTGSCHASGSYWGGDHPITKDLAEEFERWQGRFEGARQLPSSNFALDLDWESFHEEGLSLTRRLKMHLGDSVRVLYMKPIEDRRQSRERCLEILAGGMTRAISSSFADSLSSIAKIVSGGQTGVDRAALDWSWVTGYRHGGWCPKGRRSEDGTIPIRYRLRESVSSGYLDRTRHNVLDSDATLILNRGELDGGTRATLRFAQSQRRPVLVVQLDRGVQQEDVIRVRQWIGSDSILVLNIAGPRESKRPGIYKQARRFLKALQPTNSSEGRK